MNIYEIEGGYGYFLNEKGEVFKKLNPYLLSGYPSIKISGKHKTIHRLVAQTFIPNPENKPFVNHINGIKSDSSVENLEWCTQSENMKHAFRIGLKHPTKSNQKHSKKVYCYNSELKFVKEFESQKSAAKWCGGYHHIISWCVTGKRKTHKGFIWKNTLILNNQA